MISLGGCEPSLQFHITPKQKVLFFTQINSELVFKMQPVEMIIRNISKKDYQEIMEIENRLIDFPYYRKIMVSIYLYKMQPSLDRKLVPGVPAY